MDRDCAATAEAITTSTLTERINIIATFDVLSLSHQQAKSSKDDIKGEHPPVHWPGSLSFPKSNMGEEPPPFDISLYTRVR